jgi:hypothetical protein
MPARRRKPPDDYPPPPSDEESPENEDSLLVHEAYLQHRLGGGEPATPEAYRRAVEQFERLPGAVRTRPSAGQTEPPRPTEPPDVEPQPGEGRHAPETPPDPSPDDDEPGSGS